ncbi:MAG: roadblock/LC7 domain-containing protein [Promethearchaeia archaeon]
MSLEEKLSNHIEKFEEEVPDVVSTSVVKYDGFELFNSNNIKVNSKKYAAMSAGLHGISNRTLNSLKGGDLVQTYIKGTDIEIIIMSIPDKKLFVSTTTKKDPNIGLIIYQMEELVKNLKEVL